MWRKDVDVRLDQFVANSTTTSAAIGELRSMFSSFMRNSAHVDESSPTGSVAPEGRRGTFAKPRRRAGHRVTAAAAEITLSEDELDFTPNEGTRGIPPSATVVDLDHMPKEWKVAERVVNGPGSEDDLVYETQVDPQPQTKAALESVVELVSPPLLDATPPAAMVVSQSQAPVHIADKSPEEREELAAEDTEAGVGEDPAGGEWRPATPDSGGPDPPNSGGEEGQAEEDDDDAEIRTAEADVATAEAAEATGERAKSMEAPTGAPSPSQKKSKKPPKSPAKVFTPPGVFPLTSSEVRPSGTSSPMPLFRDSGHSKLIVFNVHGTLLDCSMLSEKNPNTAIRSTTRTALRRVVFRPWLKTFLCRCFSHHCVGFWGSGSKVHMEDVLSTVLADMKGLGYATPLFAWSGRVIEGEDIADGSPMEWGKQLEAVYAAWPRFCAANTVIVDSKHNRVQCNPEANVIISTPFYVKWMCSLADDKEYLKRYLWPLLEALHSSADVADFRSKFPQLVNESMSQMLHRRRVGHANEFLDIVEGEGIRCPRACTR